MDEKAKCQLCGEPTPESPKRPIPPDIDALRDALVETGLVKISFINGELKIESVGPANARRVLARGAMPR